MYYIVHIFLEKYNNKDIKIRKGYKNKEMSQQLRKILHFLISFNTIMSQISRLILNFVSKSINQRHAAAGRPAA